MSICIFGYGEIDFVSEFDSEKNIFIKNGNMNYESIFEHIFFEKIKNRNIFNEFVDSHLNKTYCDCLEKKYNIICEACVIWKTQFNLT